MIKGNRRQNRTGADNKSQNRNLEPSQEQKSRSKNWEHEQDSRAKIFIGSRIKNCLAGMRV